MRRLFVVSVILLVAPGVAYAGGGGVDTSGCAGYAEGSTVSMRDSCFAGIAHFAPSNSTITIRNDGQLPHTYTAVDGSFDTGQVAPGASTELTWDEPGIYRVYCALHGTAAGEGMAGVVVIGEAVPASMSAPLDTTAIQEAVAVPTESDTGRVVVNITVGLATGLALAALITAGRARRAESPAERLERLEPSAGS